MGADIHLYVEYKDDNNKWILDEKYCIECNGTGKNPFSNIKDEEDCLNCYGYKNYDIGRSYLLFSILAGVRNDYGLSPISEPRGIPENCSDEYKKIANDDSGDHSHSYHTLKQLKEYKGKSYAEVEYDWENLRAYFLPELDLEELAQKYGGDDNIRIVFFFDN